MRRDIKVALGLIDLDMYLLEDKPIVSSDDHSSGTKTKYRKWEGQIAQV